MIKHIKAYAVLDVHGNIIESGNLDRSRLSIFASKKKAVQMITLKDGSKIDSWKVIPVDLNIQVKKSTKKRK